MESRPNGAPPGAPVPILPSLRDQWRDYLRAKQASESAVITLDLPSGMRVRATRPSLLWLLGAGKIPDALAGPIQDLIALGQVAAGEDGIAAELARQSAANPVEYAATFLAILDTVWCAAVVEPRFAKDDEAAEDALPVGSVAIDDKTFLFVWAQGVDQSVATFLGRRGEPAAAVGIAPAGDGLRMRPGDPGRDRSDG